jgi:hypothetical protein
MKRPTSKELGQRFDEVRRWLRALEEGSRAARGFGYDIDFEEVAHQQLGRNDVARRAFVPTPADALRLIGKARAADKFHELRTTIVSAFPTLAPWIVAHPLRVLENEDRWDRLLSVLTWLIEHPHSGLYVRQLEIAGVDTKFIENVRGLLTELLTVILPMPAVAVARGTRFEERFGLKTKPALVRFRILDQSMHLLGFSDVTVPVSELARRELPVEDVFVTENEVNGLAFPQRKRSLILFGQGYAVGCLAEIGWLKSRRLIYWGDLDTHGFAMLDRFRSNFPSATSMLMDRETLVAHRAMWVEEEEPHLGTLDRLNDAEQALFRELQNGTHGPRVRLEQERIAFGWVRRRLDLL